PQRAPDAPRARNQPWLDDRGDSLPLDAGRDRAARRFLCRFVLKGRRLARRRESRKEETRQMNDAPLGLWSPVRDAEGQIVSFGAGEIGAEAAERPRDFRPDRGEWPDIVERMEQI